MKILFLDIDGVLNAHEPMDNGFCGIKPECVARLNRILRAAPDAKIVVHSAWRYLVYDDLPTKFLENLLLTHGVDCFGRVHGRTRWDAGEGGEQDRANQIMEYIEQHGVECCAVLDDLQLPVCNLIQTDGAVGLTDDEAGRVILMLSMFQ